MELPMKSPVSERRDSTTDVEAQLVLKDKLKRDALKETKSEKLGFYIAVFAGFGCSITVWILAVFLTCFYAFIILDSEDGIAVASVPLVCLMFLFILLLPLLVCSRSVCRVECDNCPGCYAWSVLILGLLMLLSAVFVTLSAAESSSSTDRIVGGVAAGVDFVFGIGILCTVFYYCAKNRR